MPATVARHRDERNGLPDDDLGKLVPETETIVLSARDWEFFLAEWDNPDKPRPRLEEAIRRYQSRRRSDAG
jgi:hypothetical protein